jgi:hypothetical protein
MMEMRTVRLVRRHTHAGRTYEPGAQLSITKKLADWLIAQGVASGLGAPRPAAELSAPAVEETELASPATPITKVPMRTGGCCGGRW